MCLLNLILLFTSNQPKLVLLNNIKNKALHIFILTEFDNETVNIRVIRSLRQIKSKTKLYPSTHKNKVISTRFFTKCGKIVNHHFQPSMDAALPFNFCNDNEQWLYYMSFNKWLCGFCCIHQYLRYNRFANFWLWPRGACSMSMDPLMVKSQMIKLRGQS